jgi:hypothetical protein
MKMIGRTLGYYEGKPALFLGPVVRDNRKRFIIKMDDAWKYSEDHNDHFESFLANRALQLWRLFDIQVPKGKKQFVQLMSHISSVIMEGIDDLVKMLPRDEGTVEKIAPIYDVEAPKAINMEDMEPIFH